MADAFELDESGPFAQLFSSLDKLFGLRERDDIIISPVD
jgi:hypothetical protein